MFAEADIEAVGTELLREQEQPATSKKPLGSGDRLLRRLRPEQRRWSFSAAMETASRSIRNGRTRRWNAWSGVSGSGAVRVRVMRRAN